MGDAVHFNKATEKVTLSDRDSPSRQLETASKPEELPVMSEKEKYQAFLKTDVKKPGEALGNNPDLDAQLKLLADRAQEANEAAGDEPWKALQEALTAQQQAGDDLQKSLPLTEDVVMKLNAWVEAQLKTEAPEGDSKQNEATFSDKNQDILKTYVFLKDLNKKFNNVGKDKVPNLSDDADKAAKLNADDMAPDTTSIFGKIKNALSENKTQIEENNQEAAQMASTNIPGLINDWFEKYGADKIILAFRLHWLVHTKLQALRENVKLTDAAVPLAADASHALDASDRLAEDDNAQVKNDPQLAAVQERMKALQATRQSAVQQTTDVEEITKLSSERFGDEDAYSAMMANKGYLLVSTDTNAIHAYLLLRDLLTSLNHAMDVSHYADVLKDFNASNVNADTSSAIQEALVQYKAHKQQGQEADAETERQKLLKLVKDWLETNRDAAVMTLYHSDQMTQENKEQLKTEAAVSPETNQSGLLVENNNMFVQLMSTKDKTHMVGVIEKPEKEALVPIPVAQEENQDAQSSTSKVGNAEAKSIEEQGVTEVNATVSQTIGEFMALPAYSLYVRQTRWGPNYDAKATDKHIATIQDAGSASVDLLSGMMDVGTRFTDTALAHWKDGAASQAGTPQVVTFKDIEAERKQKEAPILPLGLAEPTPEYIPDEAVVQEDFLKPFMESFLKHEVAAAGAA